MPQDSLKAVIPQACGSRLAIFSLKGQVSMSSEEESNLHALFLLPLLIFFFFLLMLWTISDTYFVALGFQPSAVQHP